MRALMLFVLLGLTPMASAAEEAGEPRFLIEMELWLHGEKHGSPLMIVAAASPGSIAQINDETGSGWRIELEVEKPGDDEGAPGGALWLHLSVHEKIDGEWEHLADTMLGVPEGQTATMTVVEGEVADPGPENSIVYLTAKTSRLRQPLEIQP